MKQERIMRLRGLLRKEALQILRDPSSIAIAVAMPLILLLIFGYGVSLDAKRVPLALVVERPTPDTTSFTAVFFSVSLFRAHPFRVGARGGGGDAGAGG
jgi:ABC-2 type transport system permease protein